ncbi:MAG: phenylalanine 4-monooxygenase [Bdellovibrionales bacterium]
MEILKQKDFGESGTSTWKKVLDNHSVVRKNQIVDVFHEGLEKLEIYSDKIPSLEEINFKLKDLSGFQGVFVKGLEEGKDFYKLLAERKFPIGNFIRSADDLNYTPEPDIIHDLYGHLPFFIDKEYGDFCQRFGEAACRFVDEPELFRQFERVFWFTIEFGLIKTKDGVRVFGAGIASSIGECEYSLSDAPEVLPFDIDVVRKQEFRIDEMQKRLFLLESAQQLYDSLPVLCNKVESER